MLASKKEPMSELKTYQEIKWDILILILNSFKCNEITTLHEMEKYCY